MIICQNIVNHRRNPVFVFLFQILFRVESCHRPDKRIRNTAGKDSLIIQDSGGTGDRILSIHVPFIAFPVQHAGVSDHAIYDEGIPD